MENFMNKPAEADKKGSEIPKRGEYQHIAKDGTVGFYETPEELKKAIEDERENAG